MSAAVFVLAIISIVVAETHDSKHGRSSVNSSASIPGGGPSLGALTQRVKAEITGTGTDTFGITDVKSVVCNPPQTWSPGHRFTCYAYNSNDNKVGEYVGTVEPNSSSGHQQWDADWKLNPAYALGS